VSSFRELFGAEPEVSAEAPGRANLIGEHTDYSGGFVLPVTIPQRTRVELRRRSDDTARVHSVQLGRTEEYRVGAESPRHQWLDYVQGITAVARPRPLGGFEARIDSDVPLGVDCRRAQPWRSRCSVRSGRRSAGSWTMFGSPCSGNGPRWSSWELRSG